MRSRLMERTCLCAAVVAIFAGNARAASDGGEGAAEVVPGRPLAALSPGETPTFPFTDSPSADPMLAELARATGRPFAALDAGPFRTISQDTAERARGIVERTIEPVRAALLAQFFEREPSRGIRLVLFSDNETYRAGARLLSSRDPDTPFGYYSPELRAVMMNLATGGGTLVHEMVHTFTEVDFPGMPAWFNEGLASLYEQCNVLPGRLRGLPNWRLPALQEALRSRDATGAFALLAGVIGSSTDEFYGEGSGLRYATARYLCYDLQERGLLERFYREFRQAVRAGRDPTGRATLEKLLGLKLERYAPLWRASTLALRFP